MKSFEEALAESVADLDLLRANVRSSRDELMAIPAWTERIEAMATDAMVKTVLSEGGSALGIMCASLHLAFEWGRIVGMKMERE